MRAAGAGQGRRRCRRLTKDAAAAAEAAGAEAQAPDAAAPAAGTRCSRHW